MAMNFVRFSKYLYVLESKNFFKKKISCESFYLKFKKKSNLGALM